MRVASLYRAVFVAHPLVHEFRRGDQLLHDDLVRVPKPVRRQAGGDRQPARISAAGGVATPRWDTWPGVGQNRYRPGGLRRLLRVLAGSSRLEQPGREAVAAPVRGEFAGPDASDVAKVSYRFLDLGTRRLWYRFRAIEYRRDGTG